MIAILAAASLIASYDCQIGAPKALGFEAGRATTSDIGMPPASLRFSVSLESGNPMMATVAWPGDPLTMAGKFPAIATAPGAYAFSAFSSGPCLFTEQACLSQFNLVDLTASSANIIVTPVALTIDEKSKIRTPFAVIATGQCNRTDRAK
jgi:hypothetical protein